MDAFTTLERLGLHEQIENLSAAFGLPHAPEFDLGAFGLLRAPELAGALDEAERDLSRRRDARSLWRRGRLRRAAGDLSGALGDAQEALNLEPEFAHAHALLGEADLSRPEAEKSLTRALTADPKHTWARLYRGAARLRAGNASGALEDLRLFVRERPSSPLGLILLGRVEELAGARAHAAQAYARAWQAAKTCSAAALLRSRVCASFDEELTWLHRAYDASPVLGFISLQIHRTAEIETAAYVRRIRSFCFAHPDQIAAYSKREAAASRASYYPFDDRVLVRRLLDARPDTAWIRAFYGRASCYSRDGVREGLAHLSRAAKLRPEAGWIRAWRGNARKAAGDARGAAADYEASIRLQPGYQRAYVWRAALLTSGGRAAQAMRDLDRALPLDPEYPLCYFERARARRAAGDWTGAATDLERAFALDERYEAYRLASFSPSRRELRREVRAVGRAAARFPTAPSLRVWRGQLLLRQGAPASLEAIDDFERAALLDPQHAAAHAWAGRALLEAGAAGPAAARLERALALDPRLHAARLWLAEALNGAGRAQEARRALSGALRARRLNPRAFYLIAAFARQARRPAQAEAALSRALLYDGKFAEAYLLLSIVRLERRNARGALEAAVRCVEVAPNLGRAYLARAAALQALGRGAEAVADYRRVLSEFPYLLNDVQRARAEELLASA